MDCSARRCAVFDFLTYLLTISGIYAIMALGRNIQAGYGGLLNFGHIAFAGIGAYATGIAHVRGWPVPAGTALGMALATALRGCMRKPGAKGAAGRTGLYP